MDPLKKELLLRDVERYGYRLVKPATNPATLLTQMILVDDGRVLEGFPVVLTNVLMSEKSFDLREVEDALPSSLKKRFRLLSALTYIFLFWVPESERVRLLLQQYLKLREPTIIETVKEKLRNHHKLNVGANVTLDEERLERTYKNYVLESFMETKASFTQKLETQRNVVFNEAASELFTEKQRELMNKVLNQEILTKTEREYYSRVIKKRLKALRNSDLQTMAATLLGF